MKCKVRLSSYVIHYVIYYTQHIRLFREWFKLPGYFRELSHLQPRIQLLVPLYIEKTGVSLRDTGCIERSL